MTIRLLLENRPNFRAIFDVFNFFEIEKKIISKNKKSTFEIFIKYRFCAIFVKIATKLRPLALRTDRHTHRKLASGNQNKKIEKGEKKARFARLTQKYHALRSLRAG